jgi:hypothetical protein
MHHGQLIHLLNTIFHWLAFQNHIQNLLDLILDPEASHTKTFCAFLQFLAGSGTLIFQNMPKLFPPMFVLTSLPTVSHSLTHDAVKALMNNEVPMLKVCMYICTLPKKHITKTLTIRVREKYECS